MRINNYYQKTESNLLMAFTLIEMLVVISIIGILSSLVLVSFTSSQRQTRDAKRKSDIKQYQTILEEYANRNNNFYPSQAGSGLMSDVCTNVSLLNYCPDDPKTPDRRYFYLSNDSSGLNYATEYVIWTELEGTDNNWIVCSNGTIVESSIQPESDCENI